MADNLPPSCAVVTKSGNLNFLEPSGLSRPVIGLLYLYVFYIGVVYLLLFYSCRLWSWHLGCLITTSLDQGRNNYYWHLYYYHYHCHHHYEPGQLSLCSNLVLAGERIFVFATKSTPTLVLTTRNVFWISVGYFAEFRSLELSSDLPVFVKRGELFGQQGELSISRMTVTMKIVRFRDFMSCGCDVPVMLLLLLFSVNRTLSSSLFSTPIFPPPHFPSFPMAVRSVVSPWSPPFCVPECPPSLF